MQSGQGGIRWNSSTNYIQLMDENKNWIDWRYYSTDYEVTHTFTNYQTTASVTITLDKEGLYCVTDSQYSSPTITTTGVVVNNYFSAAPNGSGYKMAEAIIYSDGSKTVTISNGGEATTYGGGMFVIYIGPYHNITSPSIIYLFNQNNQSTEFTTQNQFIHFVLRGSTRYTRNFTTNNIENQYITIFDPNWHNLYSAACINKGGKVTCTGGCETQSSNQVGAYFISSYTLVE